MITATTERTHAPGATAAADAPVERLVAAVRRATGVDFAPFNRAVLTRKLTEAARAEGLTTLADYADRLERRPRAAARLAGDLLNRTTAMFRDRATFDLLRFGALPELVGRRRAEGATALRAWVAACSTGEEAYSVAMCLADAVERRGAPLEPSVVASDVDVPSLARAETGLVAEPNAAAVPTDLAERWLVRAGGGRRIEAGLRARVRFSRHDVVGSARPAPAEAAFASFDLVSCRNLLIYLEPSARERVVRRLVRACAPGALLLLGGVERPPEEFADRLRAVESSAPLYWVTP